MNKLICLLLVGIFPALAQDKMSMNEVVSVQAGKNLPMHRLADNSPGGTVAAEYGGMFDHPLMVVARHPDPGCSEREGIHPPASVLPHESSFDKAMLFFGLKHRDLSSPEFQQWETSTCGKVFYSHITHNMRTSAGTNWEYNQLLGTSAAVMSFIALSNSAITPAVADTSLSGEITTNGLARAGASATNASTTLSVPAAPVVTVVGTTGATSYFYWVASCGPLGTALICTTPSPSGSTTTANATLSTTNYDSVAFTGQLGAVGYQLYRTTSNVAPSGSASVLVGGAPACSTAGTVVSCTWLDTSNTLSSVTIPASNLTNFGKATLAFTWTATGAQSAQAFGIFNASSAGTMFAEGVFTPVSLNVNDTIQLTYSIFF